MTEAQKESEYFYIWKALCSWLVVLIHCRFPGVVGEALDAVARISVPFFFAVSGWYLFRSDDTEQQAKQLKSKAKKTAWLTLRVSLFYIIFAAAMELPRGEVSASVWFAEKFAPAQFLKLVLLNHGKMLEAYAYHLWYLFALVDCYLVLYCSNRLDRKFEPVRDKRGIVFVLLAVMFILELTAEQWEWYGNWLFVGLPFILVGVYAKRNMIHTPPCTYSLRDCVKCRGKIPLW